MGAQSSLASIEQQSVSISRVHPLLGTPPRPHPLLVLGLTAQGQILLCLSPQARGWVLVAALAAKPLGLGKSLPPWASNRKMGGGGGRGQAQKDPFTSDSVGKQEAQCSIPPGEAPQ